MNGNDNVELHQSKRQRMTLARIKHQKDHISGAARNSTDWHGVDKH